MYLQQKLIPCLNFFFSFKHRKLPQQTGLDSLMPYLCVHCNILITYYVSWGQFFQRSFMCVLRTIYDSQTPLLSQHQVFNHCRSIVLVQMHHEDIKLVSKLVNKQISGRQQKF